MIQKHGALAILGLLVIMALHSPAAGLQPEPTQTQQEEVSRTGTAAQPGNAPIADPGVEPNPSPPPAAAEIPADQTPGGGTRGGGVFPVSAVIVILAVLAAGAVVGTLLLFRRKK